MNRSGEYVTNLSGDSSYSSFKPSPLPPEPALNISSHMISKLVEANRELVKLDTAARLIPNTNLFISMYVRKEALISSQIEGTQCTLDDVLDPELDTNSNLDVADVINYVQATNYALERLKTLPLCCRLLREIHNELMKGVRGQEKNPGEFRTSQNWIGPANCSLKDARYIPPNKDDMLTAMSDLEKFMNENEDYDALIRIALIHYQFETIHPFLDGNGRVGRLMILLYLMEQKLLSYPVIYISYFLKKNQIEYYDRISEVRRTGNYEQWVVLHDNNIALLPKTNRKVDNVRILFDYIEKYPIIDIIHTSQQLGVSYNTISNAVRKLQELGILSETTNSARNKVFAYSKYLDILKKDTN